MIFRRRIFVSQYRKIFFGEHFFCFKMFRLSKYLMHQRMRRYYVSPLSFFCLTIAKKFVAVQFGASEVFFYRSIFCIRGGYNASQLNSFVSQYKNILWGTIRCFRNLRVLKDFLRQRGGYHVSPLKILVSEYQKIYLGSTLVLQKNSAFGSFLA